MTSECGVAALLRTGGPVPAPLRMCCVAVLVGRTAPDDRCAAAREPADLDPPLVALDVSGAGT
jgi:hypothetical protein